jgi:carbonic anhydrase
MHPGEKALENLLKGNARFVERRPVQRTYDPEDLAELAQSQEPVAAVITCSDSRITPEIVFDQPLGSLFVSRVPGNVASDSAKWMIDIAVADFKVPLLVVMGHTGCLAVGQVVKGETGGAGGPLRLNVLAAVYRAQRLQPQDLWREAIVQNAHQTIEQLAAESYALRAALAADQIRCVSALYEMETGRVLIL